MSNRSLRLNDWQSSEPSSNPTNAEYIADASASNLISQSDLEKAKEQIMSELRVEIEKATKETEQTQTKISELSDHVKEQVHDAKERVDKVVEEQKGRLIEIIGVFISIFTFISVDIQIFRENRHAFVLIGFILVLAATLIVFNLVLKVLLENRIEFMTVKTKGGVGENLLRVSEELVGKEVRSFPSLKDFPNWPGGFNISVICIALFVLGFVSIFIGANIEAGMLRTQDTEPSINVNIKDFELQDRMNILENNLDSINEDYVNLYDLILELKDSIVPAEVAE